MGQLRGSWMMEDECRGACGAHGALLCASEVVMARSIIMAIDSEAIS